MTKKKQKVDWKIVCTGIVCLTGYGIYAASAGINGTMRAIIVAIIAGAIGYTIPSPNILKGGK